MDALFNDSAEAIPENPAGEFCKLSGFLQTYPQLTTPGSTLFVSVFPVAHSFDFDDTNGIFNGIENPVVAHRDPVRTI